MTEISFPVVDQPLSEDEWKTIALGFGQGVIDRGGWPYLLGTRDNVNNQITIDTDQVTGRNEAILSGFVHRIDSPKVLDLPAVTTTTTYEVGLVYDPTKHGTPEGPIVLTVWTAPGDYTLGKNRLILYRITRNANQLLSDATVEEWRQRVSPQISVSKESDLPKVETLLVDTVCLVRQTNEWWRLNKPGTGPQQWVKVSGKDEDVTNATYLPTGGTLVRRASNGSAHFEVGTGGKSAINKDYLDAALGDGETWAPGTWRADANAIARRGGDGIARFKSSAAHPENVVNVSLGDSRYRRNGVSIDAQQLDKNGNPVWWEIISGSKPAYNTIQSGTNYTVSVNSAGLLARFSSKRSHKADIQPLEVDPRRLLNVALVKYRRRSEENGPVPEGARWEWGVIADDELAREDGVPELVLTEPDPETGEPVAEGWDQHSHVTGLHLLAQWQDRRLTALEQENDWLRSAVQALAEAAGVELPEPPAVEGEE